MIFITDDRLTKTQTGKVIQPKTPMMSITHAAIACAGTSLILGTGQPLPLGLAILGSQLPDLDTTTSTIGKIFFPISSWIEDRYPHRTITHSFDCG